MVLFGCELSNRRIRAGCYAVLVTMVAFDWTFIGAALFLALMDFVEG